MYGLTIEQGPPGAGPNVKYLAQHLQSRMHRGKVVIVAERPAHLLAPLRKQWLQLIRSLQKERAHTLNAERIHDLTARINHMQSLKFSASWHATGPDADNRYDVHLATADQLLLWPPDCHTMYIVCPIERQTLYFITSWMPTKGVVVVPSKI